MKAPLESRRILHSAGRTCLLDNPAEMNTKKKVNFRFQPNQGMTTTTTVFDKRKAKIQADLQSDERDLSPKGKPDDDIIDLLHLFNAHPNYVTTSSCSGRAVVYLDAANPDNNEQAKGKWLMNQHISLPPDLLRSHSFDEINAYL